MNRRVFDCFRSLIYDRSGITLNEGKLPLVSARLGKRMRSLGIDDHREYLQYVLDHEGDGEMVKLLNAISTNVTSFFREGDHFELLKDVISEWEAAGNRRLRLWSAACSSGEEPYTLAMVVRETLRRDADVKILATDISEDVLNRATTGVYDKEKVAPIPADLRQRYFARVAGQGEGDYQVADYLRDMVVFRRLNLSAPPYPMRGPLDVVFCRNVMIYFDNQVRSRLLREVSRLLRPGGYLMVGHSESLKGVAEGLELIKPSVFRKAASVTMSPVGMSR